MASELYIFSDEMKKTYESCPLSFVYYQNIDGEPVPLLASDGFCRSIGCDHSEALEWLRTGMFTRIHSDDVGFVSQVSSEFINRRGDYDIVFRVRLGESYELIHGLGVWQTMPDGTQLALIGYSNMNRTQEFIMKRMEKYGAMQKDRFYTDYVTNLPNVNYLREFGNEKLGLIKADGRNPMLVYIDMRSMQSYNNQYGVEEGDKLLCLVADIIKETFPKPLVTRGADDHFIMLTGVDERERLQKYLEAVNQRVCREAHGNTTGIRCGVCEVENTIPEALDHAKHALKRMDSNLNRIVAFFRKEADDAYWRNRYIVENLDHALEEGWFKAYYQAIYRVQSRKLAAFEILARWMDPSRGTITPAEFIPVLLKYHLLYKLDLYMFEQVCKEIPIRHENGLPLVPVSVNFSRQDFDHIDVVGEMNRLYDKYHISDYVDKGYFIIEITEQDVAVGAETLREQLKMIRENGYRLWLDDFGSGYSSFNMFSQYQFDLIKYDMEMLHHLDDADGANRLILKDLVHLARSLKLHTLIEGVETEEHLEFARKIGCELVQGYYYRRPESLNEILFRIGCGDAVADCETPEERKEFNRKWFA